MIGREKAITNLSSCFFNVREKILLKKHKIAKIDGMQNQKNFLTELLVTGFGGAIGGTSRYLLGLVPIVGPMPVMTMLINWLGTFLLAMLGAYLAIHRGRLHRWQSFLGTGVLGGFTTFSTMIWQVHQQLFISTANALVYMILTLGGGLIMLKLGNHFGNKIGEAHV